MASGVYFNFIIILIAISILQLFTPLWYNLYKRSYKVGTLPSYSKQNYDSAVEYYVIKHKDSSKDKLWGHWPQFDIKEEFSLRGHSTVTEDNFKRFVFSTENCKRFSSKW